MNQVVVWGNCQAAPVADLLRPVLAAHRLDVVRTPPVYLATGPQLRELHETVRRCAVLVSQPVADAYRLPGCGTGYLASLLPPDARLVTFPVLYQTAAFPFMCHGYDDDGVRVDAPLTDYHDLRMLAAASRGDDAATTVDGWPTASHSLVGEAATSSTTALRDREVGLDVHASDLLGDAHRWWTMTHPHNAALREVAARILAVLGIDGAVPRPQREYLGARRAPVDLAVWLQAGVPPESCRRRWSIDGQHVSAHELAEVQLAFYRARPDVVEASLEHARGRMGPAVVEAAFGTHHWAQQPSTKE